MYIVNATDCPNVRLYHTSSNENVNDDCKGTRVFYSYMCTHTYNPEYESKLRIDHMHVQEMKEDFSLRRFVGLYHLDRVCRLLSIVNI